jgi:gamma-glutamyltranspeptidase/glutathione hydrolase
VATANPEASAIAAAVLAAGGNAMDAAVAAAFAVGVAEPQSSGIGGGGFLLHYQASTGRIRSLDFRERAPRRAHRDLYRRGERIDSEAALNGHLAVAVPGMVAGLYEAHRRLGRLPWPQVVEGAARLAEEGYLLRPRTAARLRKRASVLRRYPASARELLPGGRVPAAGARLRHRDLGRVLRAVARDGPGAFYRGVIARRIAEEMRRGGGLVDEEDLASYRPVWREPVRSKYRDVEVVSMPPPSSGGVHLLQILNMVEGDDLPSLTPGARAHLLVEAMRRAYADRAVHLGDPAAWRVPVRGLLDKRYAKALRSGIRMHRATPSRAVRAGAPTRYERPGTTHLSVVDAAGDVVSLTQSVNASFGSGVVVPGTGILLNDTMDDFSIAPGVPNTYGLVGAEANSIAPGKVPLSSMAPTLVLRAGRPWLALGSPGGPTIITAVLQVLLARVVLGVDLADAVAAPRLHHQWLPDVVKTERSLPARVAVALRRRGHRVKRAKTFYWSVNAVEITPEGARLAVADPRGDGAAAGH